MNKIVSRNYRDRDAPEHWLIRDAHQEPEDAVAVKSILATGVAFCPSSDYESGFGCSIVAYCDTAEPIIDQEPAGVRLKFNFNRFYNEDGDVVETCNQLYLAPDGGMWAVIAADGDAPAETREPALTE